MLFWKLLLFLVSSIDHSSDEEQHRINQASLLAALPDDQSPLKHSHIYFTYATLYLVC